MDTSKFIRKQSDSTQLKEAGNNVYNFLITRHYNPSGTKVCGAQFCFCDHAPPEALMP